ncbi:MAG: 50S ribosomal protein L30 [Candidatus Methanomethylophilaceae archaeon]|jgi:large subunit ribosomal protein L30
MAYAVIRVRGQPDVNHDIKHTMMLLGLNKVNHCAIVPQNDSTEGMLQKIKDYCTWGEVDAETLTEMISRRGKTEGGGDLDDEFLKANSQFASAAELAEAILNNDCRLRDVDGAKPLFRLHPPVKGYEGIKRPFSTGGALGYRGAEINALIKRML